MKQQILTMAAAALLVIPALAQDKPEGERPAGERRGAGRGLQTPEERLKFMTEKLSLTQEQQDKIKAIYAKNEESNKAAREKGFQNLSEEERTKLRESMRAQTEEINALLTDEQKEKMKELRPQRGQGPRGEGRRERGGDNKPADKPADKQ